ncbi:iron transporter [Halomicrobium sp. LC1Hm]|uniref:iron transporter n=1 Tax=Halomicrobium sp. LC1Hm TaxID=2610902 RepID=UPI0012984A59|nr:iron transporter [Halomicrobium sp. LC1Hm]QGA84049.1 Uncharacterized protein LC1Hm_3022 [Halomicrobium sp. LC1Hm]
MDRSQYTRRSLLGGVAGLGATAMAGCSGLLESQAVGEPPVVEERPNAVYYPTHVEGMEMIGMTDAGDRRIGLMYSYAHRFWTMDVGDTARVSAGDADAHLMASVWDPDSGQVLPVRSGLSVTIEQDGQTVDERTPWTMLSQNMGFHYGDNVSLDGNGTYTVTVEAGGLGIDRLGAFADRFAEPVTAEFEWEFSRGRRNEISFQQLDGAGDPGALEPMEMKMPLSVAPAREDLPGRIVGTGETGDATLVVAVTDRGGEPYLAVAPRTPYNRYVLPAMSLSATLTREGEAVLDDSLSAAIDPELGYHYGTAVDGVDSGDELTIAIDSVPQVARHEGYETAFLSMPDVELTVE